MTLFLWRARSARDTKRRDTPGVIPSVARDLSSSPRSALPAEIAPQRRRRLREGIVGRGRAVVGAPQVEAVPDARIDREIERLVPPLSPPPEPPPPAPHPAEFLLPAP